MNTITQPEIDARNAATSAAEVAAWLADKPAAYFAYVKESAPNSRRGRITTWTGDTLGTCTLGAPYRDNFGGIRQSIRVKGTNGVNYAGTYYTSAGDYCRIRRVKGGAK